MAHQGKVAQGERPALVDLKAQLWYRKNFTCGGVLKTDVACWKAYTVLFGLER
jgi:hypothetical protein